VDHSRYPALDGKLEGEVIAHAPFPDSKERNVYLLPDPAENARARPSPIDWLRPTGMGFQPGSAALAA